MMNKKIRFKCQDLLKKEVTNSFNCSLLYPCLHSSQLSQLKLNQHTSLSQELELKEALIEPTMQHQQFVLFTLKDQIQRYNFKQMNNFTVKLKDLQPMYIFTVYFPQPIDENYKLFSLPQLLYTHRNQTFLNVAIAQRKVQSLAGEINKLYDQQRLLNNQAEKMEQRLYQQFKANTAKIQDITQFGVNALQTEIAKLVSQQSKFQRVINSLETTLQQKFSNLDNNFFLQQTPSKSVLFDVSVTEFQLQKFQPEIIGEVRIEDKMGSEFFKQFVQMQDFLQKDMEQFLQKQIEVIKSDQGLQQILKQQELIENSLRLSKGLGTLQSDLIGDQTASRIKQIQNDISKATKQSYAQYMYNSKTEKSAPQKVKEAPKEKEEEEDQLMNFMPSQTSTLETPFKLNLDNTQIHKKAQFVLKKFNLDFSNTKLQNFPVQMDQLTNLLVVFSYHYSKIKNQSLIKTLQYKLIKNYKDINQFIIFIQAQNEFMALFVTKAVQLKFVSVFYDLQEGSYLECGETLVDRDKIMADGLIYANNSIRVKDKEWKIDQIWIYEVI